MTSMTLLLTFSQFTSPFPFNRHILNLPTSIIKTLYSVSQTFSPWNFQQPAKKRELVTAWRGGGELP